MSRKRPNEEEESLYDLIRSANPDDMGELSKRLDEARVVVGVFSAAHDPYNKESFVIGPEEEVDEALQKVPFLRETLRWKQPNNDFRDRLIRSRKLMFCACDPVILDYEVIITRSINGEGAEERKIFASDSYTAVLEEMMEMSKVSQNNIVFSKIEAFPRGEWSKDAEELS